MDGNYGRDDDPQTGDRFHREQRNTADGDHTQDDPGRGFDRDQAEREARDAIGNARDELQALLENQKNAAAEQVRTVADALRRTADELSNKNQHTVATYVDHVAARIDYWSERLQQRHIDALARDIRDLANRQPGLFIAGAVIIGFAATRFLRTSSRDQREPRDRRSEPGHAETQPAPRASPSAGPARHAGTIADREDRTPETGAGGGSAHTPPTTHSVSPSLGGGPSDPHRRQPARAGLSRAAHFGITLY